MFNDKAGAEDPGTDARFDKQILAARSLVLDGLAGTLSTEMSYLLTSKHR